EQAARVRRLDAPFAEVDRVGVQQESEIEPVRDPEILPGAARERGEGATELAAIPGGPLFVSEHEEHAFWLRGGRRAFGALDERPLRRDLEVREGDEPGRRHGASRSRSSSFLARTAKRLLG